MSFCEENNANFILPETGEEYIRQVQLEAQKCPAVVVADNIDSKRFVIKQTVKDNGCSIAPGGFAPNDSWQRQQVADFSQLRLSLSRYREKSAYSIDRKKFVWPDENHDADWCLFCFGIEFEIELRKKHNFFVPLHYPLNDKMLTRVAPNLSVMVAMSQPLIVKLLEYHIDWFEVTGYSVEQGRWLYAILACLEKPLAPETCSSIRSLARHCTKFRAKLHEPEDDSLAALNLFICLVARYFDQGDLADVCTNR